MYSDELRTGLVNDESRLDIQPSHPLAVPTFSINAAGPGLYPGRHGTDFLPPPLRSRTSRERAPWRPRVLYLDDRQGVGDAVGQLLRMAGCPCETVTNPETALLRCVSESDAFDVVITEHAPPRVNGLELVEKFRKAGFEGKIFVHSTRLTEEEQAGFALLTIDWLVVKPGGLADIVQGLEQWRNLSVLFV